MNRSNHLGVQIFVALMLMLIAGGCAPGSTGSGDGPSSASPPTTLAPTGNVGLPVDTNDLPIGSAALPVGQSFTLAQLNGLWIDREAGLTVEISASADSSAATVVISSSCFAISTNGPWPQQSALAVQAFGALTSTSSSVASGSYRVIIAKPSSRQIFVELLTVNNSLFIRTANLTRLIATNTNPTAPLSPC